MNFQPVYKFSKSLCTWDGGAADARNILGGKGAALAAMCQHGMPVPPGFTITTEVCNAYRLAPDHKRETLLAALLEQVFEHMDWLKEQFGYAPLVSVRSGAPVSMPGMMDTILNVGLTSANTVEWNGRIGDRATADSARRLVQMLGAAAYGVPGGVFEFQLSKLKKEFNAGADTELSASQLWAVSEAYLKAFKQNRGFDFPVNDPKEQLRAAIVAVFRSWDNERAIEYRKLNNIDDAMGTAVNIQAMVFGNMGEDSGSGVLFTRNPSTGEPAIMGEYLQNAQGEDVVAGIRTPDKLETVSAAWCGELEQLCFKLEGIYRDMVDVEFTVQKGELFILQSRTGKRSARAAFKIAVDLVNEGMIDRATARQRLTAGQFKVVRRPSIDPAWTVEPDHVGLPACPGVISGKPVFSQEDAVNCKEPCILVTHETTPEDIKGMNAAVGILTQTGGATSHAAVVARAMDKPCVTGCTDLDLDTVSLSVGKITIDGATGNVWCNKDVPVIDSSDAPEIKTVTGWCLEVMGACESSITGFGLDRPHTIQAARWWGSGQVLHAILSNLAALPQREHITLDMRPPSELVPPSDTILGNAFGYAPDENEFGVAAAKAILDHGLSLKGLGVIGAVMDQQTLTGLGLKYAGLDYQAVPAAVPGDFAAFTVLGR